MHLTPRSTPTLPLPPALCLGDLGQELFGQVPEPACCVNVRSFLADLLAGKKVLGFPWWRGEKESRFVFKVWRLHHVHETIPSLRNRGRHAQHSQRKEVEEADKQGVLRPKESGGRDQAGGEAVAAHFALAVCQASADFVRKKDIAQLTILVSLIGGVRGPIHHLEALALLQEIGETLEVAQRGARSYVATWR